MARPSNRNLAYIGMLAGVFVVAVAASWTRVGAQLDNAAYDWSFHQYRPKHWPSESIVLAIDEASLKEFNGRMGLRKALADGLLAIAAASPKAVAVDAILADRADPQSDRALETAFSKTHNLILPADLLTDGSGWDDPLPRFRRWAVAVGHVHLEPDLDGVGRAVALEKAFRHDRRWALSLEAFRVSRGATILETPQGLEVAGITIPAPVSEGRTMRIRYRPADFDPIPVVSLKRLHDKPALASEFTGKVVFAGVTAQTETKDRWLTPYDPAPMPGVKVLANAFDTIANQQFLVTAADWVVISFCILLAAVSGVTFAWLWGWRANTVAVGILALAHAMPYWAFTRGTVFPFSPGVSTAWLSIVAAALWQHVFVRRRLVKSEADRDRYQHAVQFVTHEMRTPLTAIQGSSELMSRYALTEEKRKQIAGLIHSESKRLGRMIEMFLNVERLSAGQIELKKETFPARNLMAACAERCAPLAQRKQIRVTMDTLPDEMLVGDRELMEYAFYNLLTNAIKYSPAKTEVTVYGSRDGETFHVAVQDQGIGIDQKEVGKIFQKFYRTKKAEQSGEAGTGIGLSIVEQIIHQHGGKIEVTSAPGKGSCFTLTVPVAQPAVSRPQAAS